MSSLIGHIKDGSIASLRVCEKGGNRGKRGYIICYSYKITKP